MGVYTLGVYNVGPPILDLETSLLRNLHSGGLQTGGLESQATDLGSGIALTWESTLWGLQPAGPESRATDFGSRKAFICIYEEL